METLIWAKKQILWCSDLKATALQALRQQRAKNLEDALFALMLMGDDRNIHATYVFADVPYVKA